MSDAAAAVRWLLDQAEPEARRVAVQQIAKVRGRQAPELLLRALGDDDWRVRKEGTLVAPALEQREEVIASLVAALEETINIGLRNAAVEALVVIGPDAVGASVDALSRLDADARKLIVEVLGGIADARGTSALALALTDDDENVRVAAAEALGTAALAGEDSRERAIRALADVLATSNTFLKIAALESLARLAACLPWGISNHSPPTRCSVDTPSPRRRRRASLRPSGPWPKPSETLRPQSRAMHWSRSAIFWRWTPTMMPSLGPPARHSTRPVTRTPVARRAMEKILALAPGLCSCWVC